MKAEALSAGARPPLTDPARVSEFLPVDLNAARLLDLNAAFSVDPNAAPETSLPAGARFHASLIGLGLGALALLGALIVGLLIAACPSTPPSGAWHE